LIVAHEVSNVGSDRSQLANTAKAAKEAIGTETLEAVADRGYFDCEEIKMCADAGITVTLPKPLTSSAKSKGRFGKDDFVYLAEKNVYRCPVGEARLWPALAPVLDSCRRPPGHRFDTSLSSQGTFFDFLRSLGQQLVHHSADFRLGVRKSRILQIAYNLVEHIRITGFLEVGEHNAFGVSICLLVTQTKLFGRPIPHKSVPAGDRLKA